MLGTGKQKPISGNRLKVLMNLCTTDIWCLRKGSKVRFYDLAEARDHAKRKGFTDGIHVVIAVGYGLKPRLEMLLSATPNKKAK